MTKDVLNAIDYLRSRCPPSSLGIAQVLGHIDRLEEILFKLYDYPDIMFLIDGELAGELEILIEDISEQDDD